MKNVMVPVKNVGRLMQSEKALTKRAIGTPGMGIVDGATGLGKTMAITWLLVNVRGVYIRALSVSSPASLLGAICKELNIEPKGSCAQMLEKIVEALARDPRPIFVDEADKLVQNKRLIETLRDIHDLSTAPVILVGEGSLRQKIALIPRLAGRILEVVEFQPLDLKDAQLLASQLCDVELADDLVKHINEISRGSTRLNVVALNKIESAARADGHRRVDLKWWQAKKDRLFVGDMSPVR